MKINEKIINEKEELLNLIKEGVNPVEYIENDRDIDLICAAIAHEEKSEDEFYDDSAETLLKAIIHYLIKANKEENKSLTRCKEIVESVINSSDRRTEMNKIIDSSEDNESAKVLYKAIEIATDKTFNTIFETLSEKLSKIVK